MLWTKGKREWNNYSGRIPKGYRYLNLEEPNLFEKFNIFRIVQREKDGALAYAHDMGHCYNTPFENYDSFKCYQRVDLRSCRAALKMAICLWNENYDGILCLPNLEVEELINYITCSWEEKK